jgi:hypothetical protein
MRKLILSLFLALSILSVSAITLGSPQIAQAQCSSGSATDRLPNCLPFFGGSPVNDIPSLIEASFTWLATIVATLLMVMLIYSGIRMVFSQGGEGLKGAKSSFTYSIVGFLVIIFGYVIVSMTQFFLRTNGQNPSNERGFFFNPLRDTTLMGFLNNTLLNVLGMLGTVTLLFIVWNGFRYLTAGGNDEQVKKARAGLTWSVVGLISTLLAYTIVQVIVRTIQ